MTTVGRRADTVGENPPRQTALVLIAIGAVVGALTRHAATLALPATFPWGTLTVNVVGAGLLGALLAGTHADADATQRLLVGTGFCSSFTTYSAFAAETQALDPTLAAANVAANYALGLGAVLLGQALVRWQS
jgi:CrcB protein